MGVEQWLGEHDEGRGAQVRAGGDERRLGEHDEGRGSMSEGRGPTMASCGSAEPTTDHHHLIFTIPPPPVVSLGTPETEL